MENKQALQLREQSTGLIATLTDPETAREFERGLTIAKVIKSAVPVAEVARVVGSRQVAIALDIQLTRLVASLNLKWNITDGQIKTIVEDIIDKYPNESIEDFVLCFKKARTGEYGELFRLDSAVVFVWIQRYLDEKYEVLENELRKAKQNDYHEPLKQDDEGPGYKLFKEHVKKMTEESRNHFAGMTDADHRKFGQDKPIRKSATGGYKYFKVGNIEVMAVTQQHAEELVDLMIKRGDLQA